MVAIGRQFGFSAGATASHTALTGLTNLELIMTSLIARFVKNESGATAIEYGLIAALIGVAIIGALRATGTKLNGTFTNVQNQL